MMNDRIPKYFNLSIPKQSKVRSKTVPKKLLDEHLVMTEKEKNHMKRK